MSTLHACIQARAREHGRGALTAAERRDLDDARSVQEFERPKLKALTHGLNATFYEYNELVIQYGYIVMFSPALPGGICHEIALRTWKWWINDYIL